MISEADIATLAELGVVASMQPAFDAAWGKPGELYEQRLGPSRARAMNRLGTLAAHAAYRSRSARTPRSPRSPAGRPCGPRCSIGNPASG